MDKEKRLIHLCTYLFENYKAIRKILTYDPELKYLYQFSPSIFKSTFQLTTSTAENLYKHLHSTSISEILKIYSKKNIKIITIYSDLYPQSLKTIYDPPFVLYLKGNISLLDSNSFISIIGSRRPSIFAEHSCNSIIKDLIQENWTIVSGLATGCDAIAHKLTIRHGGKTIAILGNGLDTIYPNDNINLYKEIANNHLIISEYPYFIKPEKRFFPRRNRIIAGLAQGLIVLEAKVKSGSMITANFAVDSGREVFVVPGPFIMEEYSGNNLLIQEGAKLITCGNDVLEELREFTKK